MNQTVARLRTTVEPRTARPRLWKVVLLIDDYTLREFVVAVLEAVFRMGPERPHAVMMTAHRRGSCVIAVYAQDVADRRRWGLE